MKKYNPWGYRLKRFFIFAVLGTLFGGAVALYEVHFIQPEQTQVQKSLEAPEITPVKIGGDFALVDHRGQDVTAESWGDAHKLVFFGFTNCPAICPAALQKIGEVMETLDTAVADKIQPLFITTDPARDTPEQIASYLENYDARIVGLTGTQEQIDDVVDSYRVYAVKVDDDTHSEYEMDHSAFIYLMSPEEQMIGIYRDSDSVNDIAGKVSDKLKAGNS